MKSATVTAVAPANIAFIKYWGKKDDQLRLPANDSISVNLSGTETQTSVFIDTDLKEDVILINDSLATGKARDRVVQFLDRIRLLADRHEYLHVSSINSFPTGTGLASSASGFAALTLAATKVFNLDFSERELSQLARLGSGSASRSIPDGFVEWKTAEVHEDSFAHTLFPHDYWDIVDVITIVDAQHKKISSSQGHEAASRSPFFQTRIKEYLPGQIEEIKTSLMERNFSRFGQAMETETLNFHAIILTSQPSILYWNPATLAVMHLVQKLREEGLQAYFNIDAGANVHVFTEEKNHAHLQRELLNVKGVRNLIVARPAPGARLITSE
jgi:diphosphomevalonate decarboxylase